MTMLRDADLLPYEIDDYDTLSAREALEIGEDPAGTHPTGINVNRMRLPEFYDITKYYKRYKRDKKGEWFNPATGELETVIRNKGEYGRWKNLPDSQVPDITDVDIRDLQITYKFPNTLHNNRSGNGNIYGGETVTYRRLYLILCERFNNGEFFVDTYFRDVYPYTVKEDVDVALQTMKDELEMYRDQVALSGAKLTKKGELSKALRYAKQNAPYQEAYEAYRTFKEEWENSYGEELAALIADDIKSALSNGVIPLNIELASSTIRKRIQAGYDIETVFYAMGDLIDHIQLEVKVRS